MKILQGKSVSAGIGIGKVAFHRKKKMLVQRTNVEDRELEQQRLLLAREEARGQLHDLVQEAGEKTGAENAAIFEIHAMLLQDEEFFGEIQKRILSEGMNSEYAIQVTCEKLCRNFQSMEDSYMRERAADVEDIADRLLSILTGKDREKWELSEPSIVAARDLSPSETIQLSKELVQGFLISRGSQNSHTAILARSMGIPALVVMEKQLSEEFDKVMAVLDGTEGKIYIEPDDLTLTALKRRKEQEKQQYAMLLALKGQPNKTRDGHSVQILANAGSLEDVRKAKENDAGGIGLLRSEILYLGENKAPDEERQFEFYRQVLEEMEDLEVVIRTMDIGADKQVTYLKQEHEDNPALGWRAIRIGLTRPEIMITQLCALYRAGCYGRLAILYPMITSREEMKKLRLLEQEAKARLSARGAAYKDKVPTGIMIETPAAALISDSLAPMADFFSVGTNDLIQYTLAVDRQNARLDEFCNPHHQAVRKLIQMSVQNAHAAGIPVSICGELAADMELTEEFLRMGIDKLSVTPAMVLPLRKKIQDLDLR